MSDKTTAFDQFTDLGGIRITVRDVRRPATNFEKRVMERMLTAMQHAFVLAWQFGDGEHVTKLLEYYAKARACAAEPCQERCRRFEDLPCELELDTFKRTGMRHG